MTSTGEPEADLTALFTTTQIHTDDEGVHRDDDGRVYVAVEVGEEVGYELAIPADVLAKVKDGHDIESDPPAGMTRAERWTCKTCGSAVLRYETNIYGSATELSCAESIVFWSAR